MKPRSTHEPRRWRIRRLQPASVLLSLLIAASLNGASTGTEAGSFAWLGSALAAEPQGFHPGDAIVIQASDSRYYYAVIDRRYREHGVEMVGFSWQAGDRYGQGYMPLTGPKGKRNDKLFTVAQARSRQLDMANDLASTQGRPPAGPAGPNAAAALPRAPEAQTKPASGPLDAAERKELIAAHNRWRSEVGVEPLAWSDPLAASAQDWAEHIRETRSCRIDASAHSQRADIGENLAYYSPIRSSDGSTREQPINASRVTNDWGREKRSYDAASNSCSGVCGHYTQVVWRATKQVGCGRAVCSDRSQVWVCQYSPPGNYVGQKPY